MFAFLINDALEDKAELGQVEEAIEQSAGVELSLHELYDQQFLEEANFMSF